MTTDMHTAHWYAQNITVTSPVNETEFIHWKWSWMWKPTKAASRSSPRVKHSLQPNIYLLIYSVLSLAFQTDFVSEEAHINWKVRKDLPFKTTTAIFFLESLVSEVELSKALTNSSVQCQLDFLYPYSCWHSPRSLEVSEKRTSLCRSHSDSPSGKLIQSIILSVIILSTSLPAT